MHYNITLYSQTHFNGVDIPSSPAVLATAPVASILNGVYFERMDVDIDHIDLNVQYNTVRDVDYIKMHGVEENLDFYFRAIPLALAKGTTRMQLQLDALLTLGGAENLTYLSGWQERGHIKKSEDTLFSNVVAENWLPSQPLVHANMAKINTTVSSGATDMNMVLTSVDLGSIGTTDWNMDVIEGIPNGETDPEMYFPAISAPKTWDQEAPGQNRYDYGVYDFIDGAYKTFSIPGTAVYRYTDASTYKGLRKLYSAGQLQLQASYILPKEYVSMESGEAYGVDAGRFFKVNGIHQEHSLTNMPFEYTISGYTPKNKKVFTTYRSFVITNLASGDTCVKSPEELWNGSATNPSIWIWSDPCSTGKPYCRFKWIKDNPIQYADCVRGLQWCSSQVVMEGASGSMWNSLNTSFSNQQIQRDHASYIQQWNTKKTNLENESTYLSQQGYIKGAGYVLDALDMAMHVPGMLKGAANEYVGIGGVDGAAGMGDSLGYVGKSLKKTLSAFDDYYGYDLKLKNINTEALQHAAEKNFERQNYAQALNQNGADLAKNNRVVAPTVMFTPEQNLGLYGYNYFVVYEVRKSKEDLISEDQYYQRYGYNGLHRPLVQQCFKERTHYNFVQAFDINLKGLYNMGSRVEAAAIAQLNGGVRVWRELPNVAAYETN